jgi:O-antigen ligase
MLIWVPLGFVAIFAYSIWLTARIAARRQAAGAAFVIGLLAAPILWALYLIALAQWARAELRAFLETYVPLIADRATEALEQIRILGERLQ